MDETLRIAQRYPRLRFMGSKYRLLQPLRDVFSSLGGTTVLDAFSGSGVVAYLMKAMGYQVRANDFMAFQSTIARATVQNSTHHLGAEIVERICSEPADDRDFIQRTYKDIFFDEDDRRFLDSAWSHIDQLAGAERDLALSALILSASRKQPRGVFTFAGARYLDGRRDLAKSMREHFIEHAASYNATVLDTEVSGHQVTQMDAMTLDEGPYDIVYLDPPYAPPKDDADYMKRYHFLEGLAGYWRGQTIMEETKTKKIAKRYTPYAYKSSAEAALATTFEKFSSSRALVISYSSNAVPGRQRMEALLRETGREVNTVVIPHTYSFGTHTAATRRSVDEYIYVAV